MMIFFLKLSFYLQALITDKSGVDDKLSYTSYKVWEISPF